MWGWIIAGGVGLYAWYKYKHPTNPAVVPALANGGYYAFTATSALDIATLSTELSVANMVVQGVVAPTGVSTWSGIFLWNGVNGPVPSVPNVTFNSIAAVIAPPAA